ncbi:MAG: STY0301 family protein [Stellaceae bacterium]
MRILLVLVLAAVAGPLAHAAAPRHKLECPQSPPADWNMPTARLSGVEVLSAKIGETIDDNSPPSLMPDESSLRAGTLHQSWRMDGDGSGWVRFVDCHYQATDRVLRLDANHLARCERIVTHFSETTGATTKLSTDRITCD